LAMLQPVGLKMQDRHFAFRAPVLSDKIVLLLLDQKSLAAYPEPVLFWQKRYAAAIDAAAKAGAKVFGLDVTFANPSSPWAPGNDEALATAVASTQLVMPVVCGIAGKPLNPMAAPVPVNLVASGMGLDGVVDLNPDVDDFIRSVELIQAPLHSFPL